ncbi:MAG: DUF488 family protein, partial [Calditrichia bacterium]
TRQKCLLYFIKGSQKCSRVKLAKVFFLMGQEGKLNDNFKFYGFVPYKFGPYSFELFHDIEIMEHRKMLATNENSIIYKGGGVKLPIRLFQAVDYYINGPFRLNDSELMNRVYKKYPEYTIFSEIEKKKEYQRDRKGVYSLGYEGRSIDEFLMRLIQEKIQVLADVRNKPWSMKFGFKKQVLQSFCNGLGIEYINLPELGIPGNLRKHLETKKDYDILFKRYKKFIKQKENELYNMMHISEKKRIALMCFEKDPEFCHRTIIARELARMGAEVDIG